MIRYRIKTEQEFLDEFGQEWRNKRTLGVCSFVEKMDFLLGCEITFSECDIFIIDGYFFKLHIPKGTFDKFDLYNTEYYIKSDNWYFSMDMLKQISPTYNEKKTLVYD